MSIYISEVDILDLYIFSPWLYTYIIIHICKDYSLYLCLTQIRILVICLSYNSPLTATNAVSLANQFMFEDATCSVHISLSNAPAWVANHPYVCSHCLFLCFHCWCFYTQINSGLLILRKSCLKCVQCERKAEL